MIRAFALSDIPRAREVHDANGLPENCFPPLTVEIDGEIESNALFIETHVMEQDGEFVMSCFLRVTGEIFLLLDHTKGTPEQRWDWLVEMRDFMVSRARARGLDQVSAWVPKELEKSFGPRLEALGFLKSPWQAYTFNL